ncbi:MAG TPA: hypothetical protein PLT75_13965 [Spirochaetota bacterium]|nr:hypothetical protein [Spirochaetota bacterium]
MTNHSIITILYVGTIYGFSCPRSYGCRIIEAYNVKERGDPEAAQRDFMYPVMDTIHGTRTAVRDEAFRGGKYCAA